MKKVIGILHGKERSFPEAFIKRINDKKIPGIRAERVKIEKGVQSLGVDPKPGDLSMARIS